MSDASERRGRLQLISLTLLVCLVPFGIYYLFYYRATQSYLMDRNQRMVASVAQLAEQRLASFHHVLQNAVSAQHERLDSTCSQSALAKRATKSLENVPELSFVELRTLDDAAAAGARVARTVVTSGASDDGQMLRLSHAATVPTAATGGQPTPCAVEIVVEISLSDFAGELDRHGLFDEVAIVDGEGRVLLQTAGHGTRLAQLVRRAQSASHSKDASAEPTRPRTGDGADKVPLGGESYWVFEQPMQLSLTAGASKANGADWSVYGIVREARLRDQTLSLPPVPLLVLLFLLLLSMTAWPLLKLALLGQHDRMRAADVHLLKLAVAVGVGVLVTALLAMIEHRRLLRSTDAALQQVEHQIESDVRDELGAITKLLVDYRDRMQHENPASERGDLLANAEIRGYGAFGQLISIAPDGSQRRKWAVSARPTPFFNVADRSYVQDIQRQRYLVSCVVPSPWCATTPYALHTVRSRNSASKVALVSIPDPDPEAGPSQDPVGVAQLTGELMSLWYATLPLGFSFAVIEPSGEVLFHSDTRRALEEDLYRETESDGDLRAAADLREDRWITLRYLGRKHRALVSPLGPTPWSLVVFADTVYVETVLLETAVTTLAVLFLLVIAIALVRVLFMVRSGNTRSQWAWPGREDAKVHAYWHTNVVCGSLLLAQATTAVVCGRPSVLLAVAGAALGFCVVRYAMGAGQLPHARGVPSKLRASMERSPLYRRLLAPRLGAARCYLLALIMVIGVMVVVPTWTAFYAVYDDYRAALLVMTQRDYAERVAEREQAIYEKYLRVDLGEDRRAALRERLLEGRADHAFGLYTAPPFLTRLERSTDAPDAAERVATGLLARLRRDLPALSDFARRVREVAMETPAAARGQRELTRRTAPSHAAAFAGLGSLVLYADPATLPGAFDPIGVAIACVSALLLLLVIYQLLRFVARHAFGLGIERVLPLRRPSLALEAQHALHLNLPDSGFDVLCARLRADGAAVALVDCRAPALVVEPVGACTHVVLHHFESRLVTRERTESTLEVLESLVFDERLRVIVCSEIDPVYYLNERRQDAKSRETSPPRRNGADAGEPRVDAESTSRTPSQHPDKLPDVIRWSEVFSRFDRVHHRVPDIAPSELQLDWLEWKHARQERFESALAGERATEQVAPIRITMELPRLLMRECGWDEQLHTVARAIHSHAPAPNTRAGERREAEELVQQISNRAAPRHRFIWSLCTNTEKLLLVHLAEEGTINPRNWEIAHLLVTRGMLEWHGGMFCFPSLSFERFVLQAMRPQDVLALQKQTPSTWARVSAPLLSLLVLVFSFFLWSQPGFTEVLFAVLSAGTAGIAASLRLLTLVGVGQRRREVSA